MAEFDDDLRTVSVRRATTLELRRAALQVVKGKDAGQRLEFEGRARIGAGNLADLKLADPKVSGLHCEVAIGERLRVRDLGSKNGTFVGGACIVEALLEPGDTITVGDSAIRVLGAEGVTAVPLRAADDFHGLVGQSPAMRALTARLEMLATNDTTVLLQGETGTGKERVAEALHLAGRRAQGPQVTVDCGAMPAGMIESELFGHERGAFTGAVSALAGAFERAQGGTLFLDEIGELPLELQPKLLRALESRVVRRLGGTRSINVDVRIVAATNRDLQLEVAAGRFREDLYYRIAVVTLLLPPLRERIEDLPLLAVHLLRELGIDPARVLTADALTALKAHAWPGNVRELRNTLERAAALAEPLEPATRPQPPAASEPAGESALAVDLSVPLRVGRRRLSDAYDRAYVTQMLASCKGNISEASRRAGLERISMYRILERLRLRDDPE
jgi:transcriptional regulator with GAF, ATPase, and Fis domain